jgi:hypothetical protein
LEKYHLATLQQSQKCSLPWPLLRSHATLQATTYNTTKGLSRPGTNVTT